MAIFNQVNVVVSDMAASVAFYRRLGLHLPSRDAVDAAHDDAVAAGAESRVAPHDAFWGSRYAIVADPDGNDVGLMSPRDPARAFPPTT